MNKKNIGFTLIELVVVIGVLAILLSIVMFAINPSRQFSKANNAKRRSDVIAILNAVGHYMVDNYGQLPPSITTTQQHISNTGANLCTDLVSKKYIPALPVDPKISNTLQINDCSSTFDTGFIVSKDANNRVTISTDPANEELGEHISVTR